MVIQEVVELAAEDEELLDSGLQLVVRREHLLNPRQDLWEEGFQLANPSPFFLSQTESAQDGEVRLKVSGIVKNPRVVVSLVRPQVVTKPRANLGAIRLQRHGLFNFLLSVWSYPVDVGLEAIINRHYRR